MKLYRCNRVDFIELEVGDKGMRSRSRTQVLSVKFCMNNPRIVTLTDDELADFSQDVMSLPDSEQVLNVN